MGICLRYSKNRDEAVEILNDGYLKVFTQLDKYTFGLSFKGWIRRIMINSAIDYFRKNEKHSNMMDISYAQFSTTNETALDKLSAEEIIEAVQDLPPSYRIVFNLYVIEGFKHEEIASKLNISVGTSKSNLSIARNKLQKVLLERDLRSKQGSNG